MRYWLRNGDVSVCGGIIVFCKVFEILFIVIIR